MKAIRHAVALVLLALSCEAGDTVGIGLVNNSDAIAHLHVSNLLGGHGIRAEVYGSIVDEIRVPVDRSEEATAILIQDVSSNAYILWIYSPKRKYDLPDPIVIETNQPIGALASNLQSKSMWPLAALLRSGRISELAKQFPYIDRIMMTERRYYATTGRVDSAYDVWIDYVSTTRSDGTAKGASGQYQFTVETNTVRILQARDELGSYDCRFPYMDIKRGSNNRHEATSDPRRQTE